MSKSKRIKLRLERIKGEYVLTISNLVVKKFDNVVIDGKINHCKLFFDTPERFRTAAVEVHVTISNHTTKVGTGVTAILN